MGLVIVLQRLLQVEHQVVREAERHQRLAILGVNSQALLVRLYGRVHLFQFAMAVG